MTMTNTNANKVTKLQKFEMLRNWMQEIEMSDAELTKGQSAEITMLFDFIDREMELLRNKRAKAGSAQTKKQKENEGVKAQILEVLVAGRMTASEVCAAVGISIQRASALLTQLKNEGKVVRTEEKKKVYFELPDAETLDVEGDEADSEELVTD